MTLARMLSPLLRIVLVFSALMMVRSADGAEPSEYVGVGIVYQRTPDGFFRVEAVAPGGPAERAGVHAGDRLVAVNNSDVRELEADDLPKLLRGQEGTQVNLRIQSPNEQPRELELTRRKVTAAKVPDAPAPADDPAPNPGAQPRPGTDTPPAVPQGVIKFSQRSLRDPAVRNIDAFRFLVPEGWQAGGKIDWYPTMLQVTQVQLRIADPKTGVSIQLLPRQNFTSFDPPVPMQDGVNHNGKIFVSRPITDLPTFVKVFWVPNALKHLANAELVARTPLPKAEAEMMRQFGGPGRAIAAKLRYQFENDDHKVWEEDVTVGIIYSGQQGIVNWQTAAATSARAPKGQLDAQRAKIAAVEGSIDFNPEWSATNFYTRQGWLEVLRISISQDEAMGRIQTKYINEIHQLSEQMQRDRTEHADKIAESRREVLGGVETYHDAYSDRDYYMPAGWKGYWTDNKGELVISDQQTYDPNVGSTLQWTRMDRRDPMER